MFDNSHKRLMSKAFHKARVRYSDKGVCPWMSGVEFQTVNHALWWECLTHSRKATSSQCWNPGAVVCSWGCRSGLRVGEWHFVSGKHGNPKSEVTRYKVHRSTGILDGHGRILFLDCCRLGMV